jgi:hypothetical protein
MRSLSKLSALIAIVFGLAVGLAAAGDDLVIPLKFIPTTNPAKVAPTLREGIPNRPIALTVEDIRQVKSKDLIGEGTGFSDDAFRIRYAGHLPSYLKTTLLDRFGTWGVQTDEKSNLVLALKVTRFHVAERHAFYGSVFTAEVQLPWTLTDRAGHVFASGTAMGTGKTKGRWRNPINCEEVLADALQQATATVAGDAKLQDAWLTAVPERAPAPVVVAAPPAPPKVARPVRTASTAAKTPAQLLSEVTKLRHQQLATSVLVEFVSKQTLASAFSANDLVAWKKAGVPEPVMQAALQRAP